MTIEYELNLSGIWHALASRHSRCRPGNPVHRKYMWLNKELKVRGELGAKSALETAKRAYGDGTAHALDRMFLYYVDETSLQAFAIGVSAISKLAATLLAF